MRYVILICISLLLLAGCQDKNIKDRLKTNVNDTSEKTDNNTSKDGKKDVTIKFDNSKKETPVDVKEGIIIDTDTQQEQTVTVTVQKNDTDKDPNADTEEGTITVPDATIMKRIQGFRIQVMSVSNKDTADKISQQLLERWENAKKGSMSYYYRENIAIYIEFYEPFWKIRVGNFKNKSEAEEHLKDVKRLGYSDAWVVSSMILIKE